MGYARAMSDCGCQNKPKYSPGDDMVWWNGEYVPSSTLNDTELATLGAIALGAAPFQQAPSRLVPQRAMSVAQALVQAQHAQASLPQSSSGTGYQWATLNASAIIGGHTFAPGTRIVVASSQTSTSGGGKAHTTSTVTKVWAKFGQTFDSSSWIQGAIAANLFTLTGQIATWNTSNGFGAHVGAGADVPVASASSSSCTGIAPFVIGFLLGAGLAAGATYLYLEDDNRTVRLASRTGRLY